MDSEQLMLNLFKRQQYDQTRERLQKTFMLLTAIASVLAVAITIIFYTNWVFIYLYSGMICSVAFNLILTKRKVFVLSTSCLLSVIYAGFVLVPILWIFTGIMGSAPYISLIILVSILILFSGKVLKWLLPAYLFVLLALTVISSIIAFGVTEDIATLVYIIAAYCVTATLIVLYMISKQREFDELNDKFLRSSFKDELTQLYNRKLLDLIIEYVEKQYKQAKTDYVLIMFDVDNFKTLNDQRGHVYGDIVLRTIAGCIQKKARSTDFVVRYGGDEFLVVQTNASDASIELFTGRIEAAMEESCQMDIPISVSYGFAARSECETSETVLKLADGRLYENKAKKKAGL